MVVVHLVVVDVVGISIGGGIGISKRNFVFRRFQRKALRNLPWGDLCEHSLRHDDGVFKLLQHQVVVAGACRFISGSQSLVKLHHVVGRHHQLVDETRAELSCD